MKYVLRTKNKDFITKLGSQYEYYLKSMKSKGEVNRIIIYKKVPVSISSSAIYEKSDEKVQTFNQTLLTFPTAKILVLKQNIPNINQKILNATLTIPTTKKKA